MREGESNAMARIIDPSSKSAPPPARMPGLEIPLSVLSRGEEQTTALAPSAFGCEICLTEAKENVLPLLSCGGDEITADVWSSFGCVICLN